MAKEHLVHFHSPLLSFGFLAGLVVQVALALDLSILERVGPTPELA
jgi:hypothetical protein